ncbi:hypothetical protein TNCV_3837451 [Trichonephila clavipes]|nr:hypothetical protein TNCV_3837451 [Trichonephila clavipes]
MGNPKYSFLPFTFSVPFPPPSFLVVGGRRKERDNLWNKKRGERWGRHDNLAPCQRKGVSTGDRCPSKMAVSVCPERVCCHRRHSREGGGRILSIPSIFPPSSWDLEDDPPQSPLQ